MNYNNYNGGYNCRCYTEIFIDRIPYQKVIKAAQTNNPGYRLEVQLKKQSVLLSVILKYKIQRDYDIEMKLRSTEELLEIYTTRRN